MVDLSLFPTSSELEAQVDSQLTEAIAPLRAYPFTTLDAIEESLREKVESWHHVPAFCDGWATSEEDCAKLRAWEPIQVRIHCRGRNGAVSHMGETLHVLFAKCTEPGKCPCGAACRMVD